MQGYRRTGDRTHTKDFTSPDTSGSDSERMAKESVLGKGIGHREVRPIWNNTQRINHQNKFVPTAVLTRSGRIPVSTAKQFCTVKGNGITAVKASAGCVWRPKKIDLNNGSKDNSGSWISKRVNYIDPQGRLNRCSRQMTGNKALLTDYQDIDGGFVAFGGSTRGGKITGLKKNVDAGQTIEENVSTQQYIVFLLWSSISSSYKSSDDKAEDDTVDDDAYKKTVQEPASEYDQALKNCDSQLLQEKITRASNTNSFNTVSTPVNTASASRNFSPIGPSSEPSFVPFGGSFPIDVANLPHDPLMPELEDTAEI
ncbi:hypothetical protein Tco_0643015 [Tanacetum coccineum]